MYVDQYFPKILCNVFLFVVKARVKYNWLMSTKSLVATQKTLAYSTGLLNSSRRLLSNCMGLFYVSFFV